MSEVRRQDKTRGTSTYNKYLPTYTAITPAQLRTCLTYIPDYIHTLRFKKKKKKEKKKNEKERIKSSQVKFGRGG